MFTSQYLNNALNSIHKRALRLIYNDYELPFDRLEDNKQKNIHQRNIESLAIETYKFQHSHKKGKDSLETRAVFS